MQTFCPYSDFARSASVMDSKRLWKQCVEVKQIMDVLGYPRPFHGRRVPAYYNHPAVLMWVGYEDALRLYFNYFLQEVFRRDEIQVTAYTYYDLAGRVPTKLPPWMGVHKYHSNHRARLLQKSPNWYRQFGWSERPTLVNLWPVRKV